MGPGGARETGHQGRSKAVDFENVVYKKHGGLATIALNRPEAMNALSPSLVRDLLSAINEVEEDDQIRALVITGVGRAFCAGGDVKAMRGGSTPARQRTEEGIDAIRRSFHSAHKVILGLQKLEKPTIAMVNGAAVGAGCDLACVCDIRVGSENARFNSGYIRIGSFPGWGGAWLLPRVVGLPKACELLFTGEFVDAHEALKIGLLNKLVPADQLEAETMELARKIAANAPIALRLTKLMVYRGLETDLETALKFAGTGEAITLSSEDHAEAVRAFREKRVGIFKGR